METNTNRERPSYKPIQTKRAFEEVASQIRDQISTGALRPGDRLPPERDMAEQFNLSRNTVREALRSLEIAGLLEFRKGATGGAFVREGQSTAVVLGFKDLFRLGVIRGEHLVEARTILGLEMTRLACHRATEEDLLALEGNIDASEALDGDDQDDQRLDVNLAFHTILARAAKNPVLIILADALTEIHKELLRMWAPLPNSKVIASRRRLLRHLRSGDENKAVAEMKTHLAALTQNYLAQLSPDAKKVATAIAKRPRADAAKR